MYVLAAILLPFAVAIGLFIWPRDDRAISKTAGTLVSIASLALVWTAGSQQWSFHWLSRPFVSAFHFGATPVSLWLALLTSLCTACAIAAINLPRTRAFTAWMLVLQGAMLGLFLARDLLTFALFWDLMLVPVFFALTSWSARPSTAWRYLVYNFAAGLLLLIATAAFGVLYGSTDVIGRPGVNLVGGWVPWIFAGFVIAFLVKTPVFPVHTWMPSTYADLPTPMVSVVSAVQSKAGLYGLIVVGPALMPQYLQRYAGIIIVLGVVSLVYGAVAALVQNDAKRVVAYSSLSHLGLIAIAIAIGTPLALQGAVVYLVAHGLFSAALFIVAGFVEEREGTRSLNRLGGLGKRSPRLAGAFCIACLAALGLPGLAGFAGELIMLIGIYQGGALWPAIVGLVAIVLASAYFLRLYQGIMNGPETVDLPIRADLTWAEGLAVAPLLCALLVFGVQPHALLAAVALSGR